MENTLTVCSFPWLHVYRGRCNLCFGRGWVIQKEKYDSFAIQA